MTLFEQKRIALDVQSINISATRSFVPESGMFTTLLFAGMLPIPSGAFYVRIRIHHRCTATPPRTVWRVRITPRRNLTFQTTKIRAI
jgi:hypothetical protein